MSEHDEPDGYDGEVTLVAGDGAPTTAHAALAARFDPLAGHVVWSGRLSAPLDPGTEVTLETPHGTARAQVTERDVWGNSRLVGLDRPPFPVAVLDESGAEGTVNPGA
jgi:Domain of unknown function (DUF4873)